MFTVAPVTWSPGPTSAGMDSPVTRDESTAELPSMTTPSVAIFCPADDEPLPRRDLAHWYPVLGSAAQHGDTLNAEGGERGSAEDERSRARASR